MVRRTTSACTVSVVASAAPVPVVASQTQSVFSPATASAFAPKLAVAPAAESSSKRKTIVIVAVVAVVVVAALLISGGGSGGTLDY